MTFMDGLISTQITAAGYYKAVDFGKQTF